MPENLADNNPGTEALRARAAEAVGELIRSAYRDVRDVALYFGVASAMIISPFYAMSVGVETAQCQQAGDIDVGRIAMLDC